MNCGQCGAEATENNRFCPACGKSLSPPAASPAPTATATAPASINFQRLGTGDFVAGGTTIFLLITLFLPWYSGNITSAGGSISASISALSSNAGGWRYLILILCLAIVGYLFARTIWENPKLPLPHWQLLAVATGLNAVLVLIAFIAKPSAGGLFGSLSISVSWAFGAFLGIIAAIGAVVGAYLRSKEPETVPAGD